MPFSRKESKILLTLSLVSISGVKFTRARVSLNVRFISWESRDVMAHDL